MRLSIASTALLISLAALAGCASTTVEFSGNRPASPLCPSPVATGSTVVLWGPQWRPDQKDAPLREAVAEQGLKDYVANSPCFRNSEIRRVALPTAASAEQLRQLARAASSGAERVVVVAVRELGPVVKLFSSAALVEGGTEVVLQVSTFGAAESAPATQFTVHWKNGGAGVIKGVATLPQDMRSALAAAFEPVNSPK
jgi:hypothetical protein